MASPSLRTLDALFCRGSPWLSLDADRSVGLLCDGATHGSWSQPPMLGHRGGRCVGPEGEGEEDGEGDGGGDSEQVFMTTWTNEDVSTVPISINVQGVCVNGTCI